MVAEETLEELVARRERALAEYNQVKADLARQYVHDEYGKRKQWIRDESGKALDLETFQKWRLARVKRFNDLGSELAELNQRLRELRDETGR